MPRPENVLPADTYYSLSTAKKYLTSSRIKHIQSEMTHRALQLLQLESPSMVLDIGCGTCLSGSILSRIPPEEGGPHTWVGMDISPAMLSVALNRDVRPALEDEGDAKGGDNDDDETESGGDSNSNDEPNFQTCTSSQTDSDSDHLESQSIKPSSRFPDLPNHERILGDLLLADAGQCVPFRVGTFDAAISISALQWLCTVDCSSESAELRLRRFFESLYTCLKRGARAVFQFYPQNPSQKSMISRAAIRAGFGAGILEDGVGTKNVKLYLVLTVGGGNFHRGDVTESISHLPGVQVMDNRTNYQSKKPKNRPAKGSKAWILFKKQRMTRKGIPVPRTSKYSGRSRRIAF